MRLIDADAFIEMMENKCDHTAFADGMVLAICRGAINSMPTVNPWIPCSEQMPPIGKTVLVTVKTSDKTWTDCDTWFQGDWMAYMGNSREVVAWCELPEPYKEK